MKRKNKIIITPLIILSFLSPMLVSAEEEVPVVKDNIRERLDEIKTKVRSEQESRKETSRSASEGARTIAVAKIMERLTASIQKIVGRYDTAINRLEKISARITSRIEKMEAQQINTEEAKTLLGEANLKIALAKESVALIVVPDFSLVDRESASTTMKNLREAYGDIKAKVTKAKNDIKMAHRTLVEVISNMKPGQKENIDSDEDSN